MAIKIIDEENLSCPVVICDWCGKRIVDAKDGNYEWKMDEEIGIVNGTIFFTHKECCLPFEEAHGGRLSWSCIELSDFTTYLKNNLKQRKKKNIEQKVKEIIPLDFKNFKWNNTDNPYYKALATIHADDDKSINAAIPGSDFCYDKKTGHLMLEVDGKKYDCQKSIENANQCLTPL